MIVTRSETHLSGMKTLVQLTDQKLTSNAGLLLIAPHLRNAEFRNALTLASRVKKSSGFISDVDIVSSWIAMLAIGKTDYDAIEEYRSDKDFKRILGIKTVPSAETLRQRIEALSDEVGDVLRDFNLTIIATAFERAKQHRKDDRKFQEFLTIGNVAYAVIDSDVSILDNSDSKKEGVEWTYKKCDGYAPMFSYIGASGYMLNNELRTGSMHSNVAGTLDYFAATVDMARQITDRRLLFVLDSGNDDKHLLDLFESKTASYVIKRNLRKESRTEWLEWAKTHCAFQRDARDGGTVYYASATRDIVVDKRERTIRIVIVAHERLWDQHRQMLLEPEVAVETYWTNMTASEKQVETVYHMHGTMEQYHAELKSDMGVERLPSGKFHANTLHLLCGMIAFNLLRLVGMTLLQSGKAPGTRGRRLRLRTVLQSVMYMAGAIVHHSGQVIVKICSHHAWAPAFMWSQASFSSA